MPKPWLNSYPDGVPATIDTTQYASVAAIIEARLSQSSHETAFTSFGVDMSFAEVGRASAAFAAYCQTGLGLGKGDRIALMMPNLHQYPIALFGALRAGLTVVSTNPLYTAGELRHQLVDSGAKAIVVLENFAHVLEECIDDTPLEHVVVARMGDRIPGFKGTLVNLVVKYVKRLVPPFSLPGSVPFNEALSRGETLDFSAPALNHDDIAFLQYTGGTTGVAKGAALSHGNMVANVLQSNAWLAPFVSGKNRTLIVTALPLYHIFALTANCLVHFMLGAQNLLIANPRDIPGFVKSLQGVPFTTFTGVNTLFNALLNSPDFAKLDFSTLEVSLGGGMAVQEDTASRWKALTECTLIEAYGLTETSPAVCINPLDLPAFNGCIGLPIPSTECCVRDDDGADLSHGEAGELCVRGPQVMQGYWQRPDETALVLDREGWLRTGDIAVMDERGYVRLVDRKKDMILVSGFNVYPNEIENVVALHPGVLEVGAIGVADERSGEAVKIIVVKQDPGITVEVLESHCRENLTGYKRPKHIQFVTELPKSNVGKILRRELRDQYGEASGS